MKTEKREEGKKGRKILSRILHFYDRQYRKLLPIPFLLAFLSIMFIFGQYLSTGDFLNRGISLKGGTSINIMSEKEADANEFEGFLARLFPDEEFEVRVLRKNNRVSGFIIETTMRGAEASGLIIPKAGEFLGMDITTDMYASEEIGSALGESFFREILITLTLAFVLMGLVVFWYFRLLIPGLAAILSAMFDMIITLGIISLLGVRISTAGIAAFLMLIGYSIDTSVLLTSRVLKREHGVSVFDAQLDSLKTGTTMSAAGISATTIAYIISESPVIKQIMLILVIGLWVDFITTWIQDAGILRLYVESREKRR